MRFSKTARFEGKLSVNGSGSLEGPCFEFEEHAFIESSAEMHFVDCRNVDKAREEEEEEEEDEDEEDEEDETSADGGAIHVDGNLTVTGNLSLHNCSADYGGSLA